MGLAEVLRSLIYTYCQGLPLSQGFLLQFLQKCIALKDLNSARVVHSVMISSELDGLPLLGDHLIRLYSANGTLEEACLVFSKVSNASTYSWQAILSCLTLHGEYDLTLSLYREMQKHGVIPNEFIFPCILKTCGCLTAVQEGRLIHDHIMRSNTESVLLVGNTLIDMYAKCQSMKDARIVFDSMKEKDVVTWGSMMSGYSQHEDGMMALDLYKRMRQEGIYPNKVAYLCILKACASIQTVAEGKLIHGQIIKAELERDELIGNSLVDMYAKCGSLEDACKILNSLNIRTVSSWNATIGGYSQYGGIDSVTELFHKMQQEGIMPDTVTYACVLTACGSKGAEYQGKSMHQEIVYAGFESNEFVGNALINMYAKCGKLMEAHNVFDSLPTQNSVSWSALVAGYALYGHGLHAIDLFNEMIHKDIKPDEIVFSCVLKACTSIDGFYFGKMIHIDIVNRGLELDVIVGNTLVDFYVKFGSMADALEMFGKLVRKSVVSWGTLLAGYAQQRQGKEAFDLFKSMLLKGTKPDNAAFSSVVKACACSELIMQGRWIHGLIIETGLPPDVAIGNALIEMYMKCYSIEDARHVFDAMCDQDVVSWNIMLTAYTQCGHELTVLDLFGNMQHNKTQPNEVTFLIMLRVCGNLGALAQLKLTHNQIVEVCLEMELVLGNSLIDMYAKCGSIVDSQRVFDMQSNKDEVSWGAIISGHTQHGNNVVAWECLKGMHQQGLKPNAKIYTSILSACSHVGGVEQGQRYFESMKDLGIVPTVEHYNCMIDLLGRAGFLEDAKQILDTMPVSPDVTGWMSLLSSSRAYADVKMAKQCVHQIVLLDQDISAAHALMSNLCTEIDVWEELESLIAFEIISSKRTRKVAVGICDEMQKFVRTDSAGKGKDGFLEYFR